VESSSQKQCAEALQHSAPAPWPGADRRATLTAMLRRAPWLPVLAACLACLGTSCATGGRGSPDAHTEWEEAMEDVVGPIYDDVLVPEAERSVGAMQLDVVAMQASRAADVMALGHGRLEWRHVPRFATFAAESEAWLRGIADTARAGDESATRRAILDGELDHCDRCHAACR
jgi:hypothetical protein